jgi:fimbrial chaperone protein
MVHSRGWLLALFLSMSGRLDASGFGFVPTQLYLGPRTASANLKLKNQDTRAFRFQLSVVAWTQDSKGEAQLIPTKDIVVFPLLFTLEPGQERIVRVGATTLTTDTERTYRLVVKELPPLERVGDPRDGVRVLTGLSIPIFVQPARPVIKGGIDSLALRNRKLSFHVNNPGNVHFQLQGVSVRGLGATGENLFEARLPAWYVLAGGLREYEVELLPKDCTRTRKLAIEAKHERGSFNAQFEFPQCTE